MNSFNVPKGKLGNGGSTARGLPSVCSEIYVAGEEVVGGSLLLRVDRLTDRNRHVNRKNEYVYAARLIYHEALHNLTGIGKAMHSKRGLYLGKKEVPRTGPPSDEDTKLLARHLRSGRSQWKSGWDSVAQRFGHRNRPPAPQKAHPYHLYR